MGILSELIRVKANAPLKQAETAYKAEQLKLEQAKTKWLLSQIGGIDANIKNSDMPANSLEEADKALQELLQKGETQSTEGGVIDQMVGQQPQQRGGGSLDDMSPMDMALMKAIMNVDAPGAGRLSEQRKRGAVLERQGNERIEQTIRSNDLSAEALELSKTEWKPVVITNADGSKTTHIMPKFAGASNKPTMSFDTPPPVETFTYKKDGAEMTVIRNKRTGENVTEPIKKANPKGAPAESAGKVAMAMNAVDYAKQLKAMIIDPETKKVNRALLMQMMAPGGGIGEGRKAKSLFRDAMDARIRAATGAAINAEEIPYYESVYMAKLLDNDSTIADKFKRFDEFLNSYLETMDPNSVIRNRVKTTQQGTLPEAAFKQLKPGVITTFENGQQWMLDSAGEAIRMN